MTTPTPQSETIVPNPYRWPRIAGAVTAAAVVLLPVFAFRLLEASQQATAGPVSPPQRGSVRSPADGSLYHPEAPAAEGQVKHQTSRAVW